MVEHPPVADSDDQRHNADVEKNRESLIRQTVEQERAVSAQLREIDKLKDQFLANTSHELRTPLYGITGLAESLIEGGSATRFSR